MTTDEYPLSNTYTKNEIDEADRLWDEYPLPKVSEKTGIPLSTLKMWSERGYIDTETEHRGGVLDQDMVDRADDLWDRVPLTSVSDILDIPYNTLLKWSQRGHISTDTNHRGSNGRPKRNKHKARLAAELVYDKDLTVREVAERWGVSRGTISRYLKMYRTGQYVHPEKHA